MLLCAVALFVACKDDECDPEHDDPAVTDVGVTINGVIWATRNVGVPGTFVDKPEDYGMYYQWNRRTGWSSADPMVSVPADNEWATYEELYSEVDFWEEENDPCPPGWSPPTSDDILKLCDWTKVDDETIELNGEDGHRFTNKETGESLFMPTAGNRYRDGVLHGDNYGYYWSRSVHKDIWQDYKGGARFLTFTGWRFITPTEFQNSNTRDFGMSVRCVRDDNNIQH